MTPLKSLILLVAIAIPILSCDEPVCENTNAVFVSTGPDSFEYKRELVSQLEKSAGDLSYYLAAYLKENEKEYILVNIHGKDFCARAKILVNDWRKLAGIRQTGGASYQTAELKGLEFNIKEDATGVEFVFKDLDYILD